MDFHRISSIFIEFDWFSSNLVDFHWFTLNLIDFHWLSLIFIDFHRFSSRKRRASVAQASRTVALASRKVVFHRFSWIFIDFLRFSSIFNDFSNFCNDFHKFSLILNDVIDFHLCLIEFLLRLYISMIFAWVCIYVHFNEMCVFRNIMIDLRDFL